MIYKITTIHDLLTVPIERRSDCLSEIELSLALHEFAFGDDAVNVPINSITWTDDGDKSITTMDQCGDVILSLKVMQEPAP